MAECYTLGEHEKRQWDQLINTKQHTEYTFLHKYRIRYRGPWVAQLVKPPTLDFGLGHDPRIVRWSPSLGSMWSLLKIFFLPLPLPLPSLLLLSLKLKKKRKQKNRNWVPKRPFWNAWLYMLWTASELLGVIFSWNRSVILSWMGDVLQKSSPQKNDYNINLQILW